MSDQHNDIQSIEDLYPPIMVRPVPFSLSPAFLHQLGLERAVAALESVTADDDRQPRRFVGLWWDPTANSWAGATGSAAEWANSTARHGRPGWQSNTASPTPPPSRRR